MAPDFSFAASWTISALSVGLVIMMGVRNRRSGWRRDRTDVMGNVLMTWARQQANERDEKRVSAVPAAAALQMSEGIAALALALGSPNAAATNASPRSSSETRADEFASVPSQTR